MGVDPTVSQREIGYGRNYHKGWEAIRHYANQTKYLNSVLNVKAVVVAFNQEKALVGAFSVIMNLRVDLFAF